MRDDVRKTSLDGLREERGWRVAQDIQAVLAGQRNRLDSSSASKGVSVTQRAVNLNSVNIQRDFSNHVVPVVPAGTVCSCPSMT